jgi:tetratricopeptide (TPR) repeat protein
LRFGTLRAMESPRRPRTAPLERAPIELPRGVVGEIRQTAKPGRADEAAAHVERAVAALESGDAAGAAREAERAKSLAPRSPAVREILGLAYYAGERWRETLREMQAYRRLSGRLDENHVIADAHRALGQSDRAVEDAARALDADVPDEVKAEAAIVGASAFADMGQLAEGLGFLRRLVTSPDVGRPFDLRIWYVAGDLLERMGRREDAAREFLKILRHDREAFDAAERLAALR